MRTLFDIIESVKCNQGAATDELVYALLALDAVHTFTAMDLRKFHSTSDSRVAKVMGDMLIDDDFQRTKRALKEDPKKWLGWDNDPANPEYQKRREVALKLLDRAIAKLAERESK